MTELHANDDHVIIHRRAKRYKIVAQRHGNEMTSYHYGFKDAQKRIDLLVKTGWRYTATIE